MPFSFIHQNCIIRLNNHDYCVYNEVCMNLVKTDRPIRHIIANKLLCPNVNIVVGDDIIVVRMLFERERIPKAAQFVQYDALLQFECLTNKFVSIGDKNYIIRAEGRFDLNDPSDKRIWVPGSNIIAEYDYSLLQQGIVQFFSKGPRTRATKENSAEYGLRRGMSTPIQLFCRSANDKLTICSKSIVSQKDGLLITNLDVDSMVEMQPDYVDCVRFASKFLNLQYKLTGPSEAQPNSILWFDVEVCEEMKDKVCDIYNNTLYVYADGGYVPVRTVDVKNGIGRFRVSTLGLQPGDMLRVNIGSRLYTKYDGIDIKIVS